MDPTNRSNCWIFDMNAGRDLYDFSSNPFPIRGKSVELQAKQHILMRSTDAFSLCTFLIYLFQLKLRAQYCTSVKCKRLIVALICGHELFMHLIAMFICSMLLGYKNFVVCLPFF